MPTAFPPIANTSTTFTPIANTLTAFTPIANTLTAFTPIANTPTVFTPTGFYADGINADMILHRRDFTPKAFYADGKYDRVNNAHANVFGILSKLVKFVKP